MRVLIYVFSGSGNTLLAAERTAEELRRLGCGTMVHRVRFPAGELPDASGFDVIGFGYPVHAFNAPAPFVRFVRLLDGGISGKPIFFLKTSGEPLGLNDASSAELCRILERRGCRSMLEEHFLMPYNIIFRYPDAMAKQLYLRMLAQAKTLAARVAGMEAAGVRFPPGARVCARIFRIQRLGARLNAPLYRVDKRCTGCGVCARGCPISNISIVNGRARFGRDCAMCMGCSMSCPNDAVRIGFLNLWRVNGRYEFERLAADEGVPGVYVTGDTRGFFGLFRKRLCAGAAVAESGDICPREQS